MRAAHEVPAALWLAVVVCGFTTCRAETNCQRDMRLAAWSDAANSCAAAFSSSGSDDDALALARSLFYAGRLEESSKGARSLLEGRHRSDAQSLLGLIAVREQRLDDALSLFTSAMAGHQAPADGAQLARDAHALAGVQVSLGHLDAALAALTIATDAAARAHDRRMLVYTQLALADIRRNAGDRLGAERAIARALADAEPADVAWVRLKQGMLYVEEGLPALARGPLETAMKLERAARSPRVDILVSAALNLSCLERRAGRIDAALADVSAAAEAGASPLHVHLNRGLALAEGGDLEAAAAELALAEAEQPSAQWAWWVAWNRGLVAERLKKFDEAESLFRQATEAVAVLHRHAGSMRPTVTATYREPFLKLFGMYARASRWSDAVDLLAQLDAGELLSSPESPGRTMLEAVPARPSSREDRVTPSAEQIVAAWKGRHLVIVLSDGQQVWRAQVEQGVVTFTVVGQARLLEDAAAKLDADPGAEVPAAILLGDALIPRVHDDRPVELLLVGPMARTPLAALRRDGALLIATTPVTRVLGIIPRPARESGGRAVVVGDPRKDLPSARVEALEVAYALGVEPQLGEQARRASVLKALSDASLFHLAAHTETSPDGARILLADSTLSGADVVGLVRAPKLVVLASCGAFAMRDDAGAGSLAAAFINAGAQQVMASPWASSDAAALELVRRFYAHGGVLDAPRALAKAQVALSLKLPAREWAGFSVLSGPPAIELQPAAR